MAPQRGSDPVLGEGTWGVNLKFDEGSPDTEGFSGPSQASGPTVLYERMSLAVGCWQSAQELLLDVGAELMAVRPNKPEYREVVFSLVSCNRKVAHSLYLERETALMYHKKSVKEDD